MTRIIIVTEDERPKYRPISCDRCDGKGIIPANDLMGSLAEIGGQRPRKCPKCKGRGFVYL